MIRSRVDAQPTNKRHGAFPVKQGGPGLRGQLHAMLGLLPRKCKKVKVKFFFIIHHKDKTVRETNISKVGK